MTEKLEELAKEITEISKEMTDTVDRFEEIGSIFNDK